MSRFRVDRRSVLSGTAASLAVGAVGVLGPAGAPRIAVAGQDAGTPFAPDHVIKLAEALSTRDFVPLESSFNESAQSITYDQFRDIRFRTEKSIWRGERLNHELQLLPLGWLFKYPVAIYLVADGQAREIADDGELFTYGPLTEGTSKEARGFSGFRIHGPINRADYFDEYAVFQGASYFRAVAREQHYGLSSRGLAIDTAEPSGEEFPAFRAFWIERPRPETDTIVVHALLDSPSTTGAYRLAITPGASTVMDVDATLFPRRDLKKPGIAPLTSMFFFGPAQPRDSSDFRPAVHDSQGLSIENGAGEHIWRPLTNPKSLQSSAFMDNNPRGFGLMQRDRRFSTFEDLEARYEVRPSCWVEPKGDWGRGSVRLIEIPTAEEIHDNIVCFWQPEQPIPARKPFPFSYRLHWTGADPTAPAVARVAQTRVGAGKTPEQKIFIIDFEGVALSDAELPRLELRAEGAVVTESAVQRNPINGGIRATFQLRAGSAEVSELRLTLLHGEKQISETWLYRWIAT